MPFAVAGLPDHARAAAFVAQFGLRRPPRRAIGLQCDILELANCRRSVRRHLRLVSVQTRRAFLLGTDADITPLHGAPLHFGQPVGLKTFRPFIGGIGIGKFQAHPLNHEHRQQFDPEESQLAVIEENGFHLAVGDFPDRPWRISPELKVLPANTDGSIPARRPAGPGQQNGENQPRPKFAG